MTPWIIAGAAAAAVLVVGLIFWQRRRSRHKKEQEQLDRILKEKALDRALSNQLHQSAGTVAPAAVHYVQEPVTEKGTEILRLTLEEKSVSKSYLFRRNDRVYLGSANGQPTVFSNDGGQGGLYCEMFCQGSGVYVRRCGNAPVGLRRGRQRAELDTRGIKVHTGDEIELPCGNFRVDFV